MCLLASVLYGHRHSLVKRSLLDFAQVVECATSRSSLDYYGYGCYCGFGGRGYPVDPIDRCCFDHDRCYDMAVDFKICPSWRRYMQWYDWKCNINVPTCAQADGTSCDSYICQCDTSAAMCFSLHEYPKDKPSCPHNSRTPDFSS